MSNQIELIEEKEPVNLRGERATFVNEQYGAHPRNNFDIWLADSDRPTPLLIYIHGGGFLGGDKSKYYDSADMLRLLDNGVSVATINYRFMNEPPYGIKACFYDAKRFIQYIRYNASGYNIDKNRIAGSGGSAGAGISLWLAFSDDMADINSPDPVLKESTRLTCAGAFSAQSTYDIFQWEEIIGISLSDNPQLMQRVGMAFGLNGNGSSNCIDQIAIRKELDLLELMDSHDAPVFIFNKHKDGYPENEDALNHHPLHAKKLKEYAELRGLEAVVYAPALGIEDPSGVDFVDFVLDKFQM